MDFSQENDVKINGQDLVIWVSNFKSGSTGAMKTQVLWHRQVEYPLLMLTRSWPYENKTNPGGTNFTIFSDKRKITRAVNIIIPYSESDPFFSNYSDVFRTFLHVPTRDDNYRDVFDGYNVTHGSFIDIGDEFRAYSVKNEDDHREFSENYNANSLDKWLVPDAEWSLSDEKTGKIKLHATDQERSWNDSINTYRTRYPENNNNKSYAPPRGSKGYWPGTYYELREHETDVLVEAGTPLITLNSKKGSVVKIISKRNTTSDFDDYKTKYEIATNEQFPKSQYPYLRGEVMLDCKSKSLGIDGTWGMFIGFWVRR